MRTGDVSPSVPKPQPLTNFHGEMKMQKAIVSNHNEYQMIPMEYLEDSPTNPRKRMDETKLNELAENIKEKGIYQPLLIRPLEEKRFQVVFGRRRFLAAQRAGVKAVPCRIRNLSDAEVLEAQIIENGQREDIHPLEEGSAYKALLELPDHKHTPATIAAKTGKSETYVTGRLRFTELYTGDSGSVLTRSHHHRPCFAHCQAASIATISRLHRSLPASMDWRRTQTCPDASQRA